jgi:ppGpp synthetase/RelA/SpoT-type nucleotidyltranferase
VDNASLAPERLDKLRAMTGSISKNQINKLGRRLRDAERLTRQDLEFLDEIRAAYFDALREVHQVLVHDLGLQPTSRPEKTTQTMVDKLRRNPAMQLSTMQDIAGTRVVIDMTRTEQDGLVRAISSRFPDGRVIDRRANPSFGYRAVHIVVQVQGCPVEIQVRTHLQDLWAQTIERLADRWGRQIRYGEPPNEGPEPVDVERGMDRVSVIAYLMDVSESIAALEERLAEVHAIDVEERQAEMVRILADVDDPQIVDRELQRIRFDADWQQALAAAQQERLLSMLEPMTSEDFWDNLRL